MTVDKDKLRQAANKAESYGQTRSEHARQARAAFIAAANPATVLALLDELAAMTKARDRLADIAERCRDPECTWGDDCRWNGSDEIDALRKVGTHD